MQARIPLLFALVPLIAAQPGAPSFEKDVRPVLARRCFACHNDRMTSGGLNIAGFLKPDSIARDRDGWEKILRKLRSGEMPPPGAPRPSPDEVQALAAFLAGEFERADRSLPPDPGRVTARRLNRTEYANTIRDLLAVDFRADREFPADDSGHGFDNIADVLTVSPILMEKYLRAAERIAGPQIGLVVAVSASAMAAAPRNTTACWIRTGSWPGC